MLRAPLETPLEVVAAQNHCCVKAIELLIEQELSKHRKLKEEQAAAGHHPCPLQNLCVDL